MIHTSQLGLFTSRILVPQRVPKALSHIINLTTLHLSIIGVIRLPPGLGILCTMGTVNDATENTDPGIEEVTRHIAPVRVRMCLVVSSVSCAFGSAKRRVERVAGLELHPDIRRGIRGNNRPGEGSWSLETRLRWW